MSWAWSVGLGVVALGVRLLFLHAGPDAGWPYSVHYKGDALVWLQWVLAERAGVPFEAGLPLRPPGMGWLVDGLWDGTPGGVERLKPVWAVQGAVLVAVFHRALLAVFGARVAALAAGMLALSTGGLVLSTSLGNETPYLCLVVLSIWVLVGGSPAHDAEDAGRVGRPLSMVRVGVFAALAAAATLVRAEHVLVFGALVVHAVLTRCSGRGARVRATLVAGLVYLGALVPWHLSLWRSVERFNAGEVPRAGAGERALAAVEARIDHIVWLPETQERMARVPGFTRRSLAAFVAATVQHRGGGVVGEPELAIVEEAYGTWPRPVPARPFVAPYGPLNFWLANHPRGSAGFSRAALEEPPPLVGGRDSYPAELVGAMPPPRFSFEYPPHLAGFVDGYGLGLRAILDAPAAWMRRAAGKLGIFWSGASLGFTGHGIPAGTSGVRRAVDLVVPVGAVASLWRWAVAALCAAGWFAASRFARRGAAGGDGEAIGLSGAGLAPWLLYAACRVVVAIAFFGYARQGALVLPVVYLLVALALARWVVPRLRGRALAVGLVLLGAGVAVEGVRNLRGVSVEIDGRAVGERDPFPAEQHVDREVRFAAGRQK